MRVISKEGEFEKERRVDIDPEEMKIAKERVSNIIKEKEKERKDNNEIEQGK